MFRDGQHDLSSSLLEPPRKEDARSSMTSGSDSVTRLRLVRKRIAKKIVKEESLPGSVTSQVEVQQMSAGDTARRATSSAFNHLTTRPHSHSSLMSLN